MLEAIKKFFKWFVGGLQQNDVPNLNSQPDNTFIPPKWVPNIPVRPGVEVRYLKQNSDKKKTIKKATRKTPSKKRKSKKTD